jgi:metal-responsive CopG/Arc/MetJ family transcriptional regulator
MAVKTIVRHKSKKMGRPVTVAGEKSVTIRLPDKIAKEIKAYAKGNGLKTQSESIRRMIDVALENELLKDLRERVDRHAEARGETRSEVMRRFVEAGLAAEAGQRKARK